ncbi:MAG: hypothetical protein GF416_09195 [Candidatus Altiarchaeales archaeon]|nr:hypothetical protein [Candidatus Altiarchaeales archaeon]MBD3417294.1 hypothetical protein [Candidatus Altiarchaeales archaeon]
MTVLNFKINKLSGERKEKNAKSLEVKANSTILSVKKGKDKRIGEYLHVNFRYDVEYTPGMGSIHLEGSLWYQHPKLDSVMSEVKDKVELKNEAIKEISNSVIQESIVEALDMSRKLQLPPPLQLPTVTVKPEKMKFSKAS